MSLSTEDKIRYARHLILPHFGHDAQSKLKKAKVLVIGTGGLGAPVLQYLTAAGVGTIGVVDFDVVDESNLQRQVLFGQSDIGQNKTETAILRLQRQNPYIEFKEHHLKLDSSNAMEVLALYDVIVDGTDNFPTRYLVNDACVLLNKPLVYGSIFQFEGQVSVFNYQDGPNYRDLFPTPPPPGMVPSCAEGGVLGVLPGIIGSMQASEVIKIMAGIGETLSGRLFLFDALEFTARTVNVCRDPANPLNGSDPSIKELIDYEEFCGINQMVPRRGSLTVNDMKDWLNSEKKFTLIDVRETYEYEAGNLNGLNLPLGEFQSRLSEIPGDLPIVVLCKSGGRSAKAQYLLNEHGINNHYNLEGGLMAWKAIVDPNLEVI